ncbi:hypothetical protein H0A64_11420 [Alcaligenaceae bacterium]|nr:hypothetical protein [Alcaligenaceae bacterium]
MRFSLENRDKVIRALEKSQKHSFDKIRKLLGFSGTDRFSIEYEKRTEMMGNRTSAILSKPVYFGATWFEFSDGLQDEIALRLLQEENKAVLVA